MSGRWFWICALFFFPLLTVRAETVTLTIDEAVRRALDENPDIKKNTIDLAQAGYAAGRLWSEIFPNVTLNTGFSFLPSTPLFTGPGFRYKDDELSYNFNVGVSFSFNPSFRSAMKRIELAYQSQLLSYEDTRTQLEIQVVKGFLELVTMKANISYMSERLEQATQKLYNDRIARENGLVSELEWLNSLLSAETARYNLYGARSEYQNVLDEYLALLGMETGTDVVFDGTLGISQVHLDPEQLIFEFLPKRPDIVSQRQEIERLELVKNGTVLSNRAPSLTLSSQWRGGSPSNNNQGLGAPFSDSVSGSLTLTIPVASWIPGTRPSQDIRGADVNLEKARLDLQNTETQAKAEIRSLISNLHNTWENLNIARMRIDIAARTVEATNEGFSRGTVEFQELEDRRNDLSDARLRFLQSQFSYQSLLLDLAAALNVDWKLLASGPQNGGGQSQELPRSP